MASVLFNSLYLLPFTFVVFFSHHGPVVVHHHRDVVSGTFSHVSPVEPSGIPADGQILVLEVSAHNMRYFMSLSTELVALKPDML